ncbi:transporter [Legionella taurinensis]|uniref:Transporter n=1 Tax=Legionella taurinensis TaxID=70611 RepID=A0A3A5L7U9_9GAMM|nr:efflux transporter outer membrane subunit [Legionella taurinensis]MDX1837202.1 efflux transporter outer membrane subunit [Legionella taurinensis]PUT40323.1 transporter [Legionella taurinensis]PUT41558.1 transporter [Legionella taurinensis]PUT44423.1 transporter [Legionella taurinensis]PUT48385.1 transporter [Legionella taurinensis]
MLKILLLAVCLFLSACMVGPDYKEPAKNVAPYWLQKNPAVKVAPINNADWWKVFHDPTLTHLIHCGYHNNLSLQIAGVRVLQARAKLAQSVGELYPQQQVLNGSYTHVRTGGGELQGILPDKFDTASVGLSASWEIDFWGKYRRAIRANDAAFLASLAAYDNALVSLTADIANAYISIRTLQQQIKTTQFNIHLQKVSLDIATSRYRGGQTSLLDVQQAETELAETQSSLPDLVSQLQRQKDALAVLLGLVPTQVDDLLKKGSGIPRANASVAIGIPKEALARRPDIYQARMEAVAQSESIGAVKANLYPALTLSGSFSYSANSIGQASISNLFDPANRSVIAGPSVVWPLLNYGQITNAVREQDAVFQQSLLNYLNLVLKAQQEVQDNITQYIEARKTTALLGSANTSATKTTRLALIRYREGEANYTAVLNAEQQQLRIQKSLINAEGEIAKSLVALYRALGGGWQIRRGNDIVPEAIKQEMAARTNWGSLLKQPNHERPTTTEQQIKQLYLPNW